MSTRITSASVAPAGDFRPPTSSGSTGRSTGDRGRTTITSLPALGETGPARASSSTTLVSPASGYAPGRVTSPTANTTWLR